MADMVLMFLLICLVYIIGFVCGCAGFRLFGREFEKQKKVIQQTHPPPVSDRERRRAEKEVKELQNMLSYDGEEQEKIKTKDR